MTTETNKALARRLFEAVNRGELAVFDEILAPGFATHEELPPGIPSGREGARQLFSLLRGAFPDLRATIEDEIAEGDRVVVRATFSGTHRGEFMGLPATDRRMAYAVVDIFRVVDGEVVEHWGVSDMLGLMQKLGDGAPALGVG